MRWHHWRIKQARSGHFACMTAPEAHRLRIRTNTAQEREDLGIKRRTSPVVASPPTGGLRRLAGAYGARSTRPAPGRARRAHARRGRACGRPSPCPGGDDNATAMYKGASFIHPTQETPSCGIMFSVHFANLVSDSP